MIQLLKRFDAARTNPNPHDEKETRHRRPKTSAFKLAQAHRAALGHMPGSCTSLVY
jgi:hypothetical protein